MGLLQKTMEDIKERETLPAGQYGLSIKAVTASIGKEKKRGMVTFYYSVPDHPDAKLIADRVFVVSTDDNADFVQSNDERAKAITDCFKIDYDEFIQFYEVAEKLQAEGDTEAKEKNTAWNGLETEAILKLGQDLNGDPVNEVQSYINR